METIPVVLFTYSRPRHLVRTLDSLKINKIPLLYIFSDGPRSQADKTLVDQVREIIDSIDWCDVQIIKREKNLGLGTSILQGVREVFDKHNVIIVFEDDLVCVLGTYKYLVSALNHYREDQRVMSITGWTHPQVTPAGVDDQPYFDGRAECLVWGTWVRAWKGMDLSAYAMMDQCRKSRIDINAYGADLPRMAKMEKARNIWAVRFLYWHIFNHGLCLRPPWSMVENIGFDLLATNASDPGNWINPPLKPCPLIPDKWPESIENPECKTLWQNAYPKEPYIHKAWHKAMSLLRNYSFQK